MRYTEKAGEISSLTCPPYDIISEEERLALLRENEYNIVRLELPKGEDPYGEAGRTLQSWESDGILRQDTDTASISMRRSSLHTGRLRSSRASSAL